MNFHFKKIGVYLALARHWRRMLMGKSYWHADQDLGRCFLPRELAGYYNDFRAKTYWEGPVDANELPMCRRTDGALIYFPTTLIQKCLGHWDASWASGHQDSKHLKRFLQIADWLLENQDERGGWPVWPLLGLNYTCPYSAMTQGEAISVLTRAHAVSPANNYIESARKALVPLLQPIEEGGTSRIVPEGRVLEETPHDSPASIFNGWVFALYGLYDYLLLEPSLEVRTALEDTLSALLAYLPQFDAGYWSFYDVNGHLASPFYHQLHLAQLQALELSFPDHAVTFSTMRERWTSYSEQPMFRSRAIIMKAAQKLLHPPPVVLR